MADAVHLGSDIGSPGHAIIRFDNSYSVLSTGQTLVSSVKKIDLPNAALNRENAILAE